MAAEIPRQDDLSSHLERIRSLTEELLRSQRGGRSSTATALAKRIQQEIDAARAVIQKGP